MQGSTSPAKKGLSSASCGPHPCHVTRSRTRPTARRAASLAGSRPISRRSDRTCIVESHPRFHAAPPHRPSCAWRASSRAPAPSVATLARSAPTSPAGEVGAERARVATEGAGARLLALQAHDGRWGGAAWNRGWDSTMHVLSLLREMGLDPASDAARRAVGLVRDRVTWQGCGPQEADDNPFFAGEVEPCINGQVGAVGAYFGQDVRGIVDRLLAEQLPH